MTGAPEIEVRNTPTGGLRQHRGADAEGVSGDARLVPEPLASHLAIFPEGQFVAVEAGSARVVGMAASLIVRWDEYEIDANWRDYHGMFTDHDPERGRTLYAAEVMVDPALQGRGIGSRMYQARRSLVERLALLRIRAGARLRGYHRHAAEMDAEAYTIRVVRGELIDRTLSFQVRRGSPRGVDEPRGGARRLDPLPRFRLRGG